MHVSLNFLDLLLSRANASESSVKARAAALRRPAAVWTQMIFFALCVRPFLLLFVGLRVRGGEQLRAALRLRQPFILIANHSSHLDTLALLSLVPLTQLRRMRPVAAADYFERHWLTAWLSRTLFNILPIPRERFTALNHPVAQMKAALDAGDSLIVFPAGTRGCHATTLRFRAGIAHLIAAAPNTPVLPACLINLGRSLPKGEWIPVPLFAEARFGALRCPQGARAEILAELENAVRALQAAPEPPEPEEAR